MNMWHILLFVLFTGEIFDSSTVCGFLLRAGHQHFSTKMGTLQIPALQVTVLNLFSRFVKNTCEGIHFY